MAQNHHSLLRLRQLPVVVTFGYLTTPFTLWRIRHYPKSFLMTQHPDTHPDALPADHMRHQRRPMPPTEKWLILLLALGSALMLFMSVLHLMTGTDPATILKALVIACSAGLVAYGVNRFAIEKGAPLAAIGFHLAGVMSIVAMLITGSGLFTATYSGWVLNDVGHRTLQDNGTALGQYYGAHHRLSLASGRVGPAIRVIADDLNNFAECEVQSSCLSQRGAGGFGPVAAELKKLGGRAAAIAAEFENGETLRRQTLETINALTARYQTILGKTDDNIWERRSRLQSVHAEIEQATAALSEAAPVDLLRLYAEELQQGVSIPNRIGATRRVNTLLRQHGESLSGILQSLEGDIPEPPVFPSRPGVSDTLAYIGDFISIAAIIFVVELIFPLMLWVFIYLKLYWEIEKRQPRQAVSATPTDEWNGLMTPASQPLASANSSEDTPKPKRRSSRTTQSKGTSS